MTTTNTPAQIAQSAQRNSTDPVSILVRNVCELNNGGIEQVGQFLASLPVATQAQFIERCSALVGAVSSRLAGQGGGE